MAEFVDWLNLAANLRTGNVVTRTHDMLAQAEFVKQADNSLLNDIVDLFAKARDLRQREQFLGSITLLATARERYYKALPEIHEAQVKMRLIEVDEKLNEQISILLAQPKIKRTVLDLSNLLSQQMAKWQGSSAALLKKLEALKERNAEMPPEGARNLLGEILEDVEKLAKANSLLIYYFDPELPTALGEFGTAWTSAISDLAERLEPELRRYSVEIQELSNEASRQMAEANRKLAELAKGDTVFLIVLFGGTLLLFMLALYFTHR